MQYGDGLQDDPLFVLKNYPLTEGEEGYVSNYGPKTMITFSKLNRTYLLPKDFHENDKAAFLPLAADQFLAVTPTKACVLEDDSENTDDDGRFLIIVKEIPCFEESTVMLDQGGEGYCLETSSIVLYDKDNFPQTYYYDQTKVDICELPPAEKLPISILWPTDDQRAQAEKSIQPDLNRTYLLPKDFHENDKAAFLPLAPDQFLAVTPTKACVLEDDSENTDDDGRFLIVKEILCFEESAVMLDQGGERYCLETSSIVLYDKDNFPQTYYYDQTKVDICELPPAEKLPISILWPTDDQRAQAEKSTQPDSTGRQDREQKPLSQQQEKSSTELEQQNAVASTSEAQNFE